jgi:hypothetical protein
MIELTNDQLTFSFSEVHPDARVVVEFQRTIRIPEGGTEMPQLPSLGRYPLYAVEEHAQRVPAHWLDNGGALLPMYQSEAMWLRFQPAYSVAHDVFYPFAVKVSIGGVDAVTGQRWSQGIHQWPQDYLVVTDQSWLGGYRSPNGEVQQFSAMPLGSGYQPRRVDDQADQAGQIEIVVYPMSRKAFDMRFPRDAWQTRLGDVPVQAAPLLSPPNRSSQPDALIRQKLEEGLFPNTDWDTRESSRYCLHLANSLHWCAITGGPPPTTASRLRSTPSPEPFEDLGDLGTEPTELRR